MPSQALFLRSGRNLPRPQTSASPRLALNESELAARWGISVKTLRRWRQEQLGPVFCKFGARISYLIAEIEAYERRVSRFSTSARTCQ